MPRQDSAVLMAQRGRNIRKVVLMIWLCSVSTLTFGLNLDMASTSLRLNLDSILASPHPGLVLDKIFVSNVNNHVADFTQQCSVYDLRVEQLDKGMHACQHNRI